MRFGGLVQASSIFGGGCPDRELVAAEAQAARFAVLPLHENLKLVGVPDDTHAANAHLALLDLISPAWDLVVPHPQLTFPLKARKKLAEAPTGPLRPRGPASHSYSTGLLN
jgi:hypothetical protein